MRRRGRERIFSWPRLSVAWGAVLGAVWSLGACSGRPLSAGSLDGAIRGDGLVRDASRADADWLDVGPSRADAYLYAEVMRIEGPWGGPGLSLRAGAAAYATAYEPGPGDEPGYEGRFETPDGVPCDIWYVSGLPGGGGPPEQVYVGALWVSGPDGGPNVELAFGEAGYEPRELIGPDVPAWAREDRFLAVLHLGGDGGGPELNETLGLSMAPGLLEPEPGQQDVYPVDGVFVFRWEVPPETDQVEVLFEFNLDWDNARLLCRPGSGVRSLQLPLEWIARYTWGSGMVALRAVARKEGFEGTSERLLWYRYRLVWSLERFLRFFLPG